MANRLSQTEHDWARLSREVELAREIQSRMLPSAPPTAPGYDIAGVTQAARSVGGDFFDFIPLADGRLALWLGDVVGKGLPAAMLMANLQATLRFQTLTEAPTGQCLARTNRALCQSTAAESFATLFYGVLDTETHVLRYANAGHNAPILLKSHGERLRLSEGATVLGFFDDWVTDVAEVGIDPNDLLVVYSDGISEATNSKDEQLGDAGLATLVDRVNGDAAPQVLRSIMHGVGDHTGDAPQHDDMTLVAVRRTTSS